MCSMSMRTGPDLGRERSRDRPLPSHRKARLRCRNCKPRCSPARRAATPGWRSGSIYTRSYTQDGGLRISAGPRLAGIKSPSSIVGKRLSEACRDVRANLRKAVSSTNWHHTAPVLDPSAIASRRAAPGTDGREHGSGGGGCRLADSSYTPAALREGVGHASHLVSTAVLHEIRTA